jgi:hypothetical protein
LQGGFGNLILGRICEKEEVLSYNVSVFFIESIGEIYPLCGRLRELNIRAQNIVR